MEGSKTCFLIGHADASSAVRPQLDSAIERHIVDLNVSAFYVGKHGGFDNTAIAALQAAKQRHPGIQLYILLSYHPAEHPIIIPEGFSGSYYPFDDAPPRRFSIVRANEKMIRSCDYLIAYAWHIGKARDFVDLAERIGVAVTNIAGDIE